MDHEFVILRREGEVAVVTMDNPSTGNAMDDDLGPQLCRALESLAQDPEARAVVLTGAGRTFSSGGNLKNARAHLAAHPAEGVGQVFQGYTKWVSRVIIALTSLPQPVVAAVEGAASGAGLAWLLASDLVIAAENAKLVPGFLGIGLPPAAGVTLELPRELGSLAAAWLLWGNRPLPPSEALARGLVHRLAPPGQALTEALAEARALAGRRPAAVAAAKELLSTAWRPGLAGQLEEERRQVARAADLPEFRRRLTAFFTRTPTTPGAEPLSPVRKDG
ncbi:MAG: enoyl-CoA hydratase/isomerase family protein [Deltaproteobacteria bacterium]|nr:enoyl-CoA hydratase/isomerase family protein [Deltaproteobacteria bacterium]